MSSYWPPFFPHPSHRPMLRGGHLPVVWTPGIVAPAQTGYGDGGAILGESALAAPEFAGGTATLHAAAHFVAVHTSLSQRTAVAFVPVRFPGPRSGCQDGAGDRHRGYTCGALKEEAALVLEVCHACPLVRGFGGLVN